MKVVLRNSCFVKLLIPIALFCAAPAHLHAAETSPVKATPRPFAPIRPRTDCPAELEPMTQALLRDLPQYLNRISHGRGGSQASRYAIVASQPNLAPLPVVTSTPDPKDGGLYQVFFTLLERQYDTRQKIDYQTYHWLFLAHTEKTGWQLAILYSRTGSYPDTAQEPSPLRETTREAIGQAIHFWLRDCQARAVPLS